MRPILGIIHNLWDRVRTSLWFIPGLFAIGCALLALLTPAIDRAVNDEWLAKIPLIYSGRPVGARAVLTTIASSMITIAGVVFSMTIVSLQLASSQFGPRLLRTFLRDRGNQAVLGTFIGAFLYCILVLPSVDTSEDAVFVPHMAVTIAIVLALGGLGMLVYYIDHIAQSMHADSVVKAVSDELRHVIDTLFPESVGESREEESPSPGDVVDDGTELRSHGCGYLRYINAGSLITIAQEHDIVIDVRTFVGRFVQIDDRLALLSNDTNLSEETMRRLRSCFVIGKHRTTLQDPVFAFEQLTEMACRALSPGINDPNTAIHCIDHIEVGMRQYASRALPPARRRDESGETRVVIRPVPIEPLLDWGVGPLVRCMMPHVHVGVRLLKALGAIREHAIRAGDRKALEDMARYALETMLKDEPVDRDRDALHGASAWLGETEGGNAT